MERSTRDRAMATMAARPWLLLLSLAAGVLQVRGQNAPDSTGFISIDCGMPEQIGSYVDDLTKLRYTSDAGFTDAGINHNVSAEHIDLSSTKRYPQFLNVRSFPGAAAARSCYTFPSLVPGSKYLVRASFMYGNYDGLNRLPVFDLYLGVNFWNTVNLTTADEATYSEVIAVVPDDSVQVCLVDIGLGTPFISWLDLRPLKNSLYPQVNATQALVLFDRSNFGAAAKTIRYPDDPYDRAWREWDFPAWWPVSTVEKVQQKDEDGMPDLFQAPSVVMQSAIKPLNASGDIEFSYIARPNHVYSTPRYVFVLYFSELEQLAGNDVRMLNVAINNWIYIIRYKPRYLDSDKFYTSEPLPFSSRYNFTLTAVVPNSTLPPIINAAEFFSLIYTVNVGTDARDVSAITAIKAEYQVKRNWAGDPCSPKTLAWDGLNCSYPISSPPTITSVNMSFGGLNGNISSHFSNLTAIQYLDLSHNKLTGSIPEVLSLLPSLAVLDLSDNQLSGSIPSRLLKRTEDGSLTLRYDNNPSLCSNSNSCQPAKKKSNSMVAVYIVVPIFAVVVTGALVVLLLFVMRKKEEGSAKAGVTAQTDVSDEQWYSQSQWQSSDGRSSLLQLDNRRFTYRELEVITKNFQRVIGRGGFGSVYDGFLEDGTRVAVKLRSHTSNQGVQEFLAEARNLTKIHHKNLVTLLGYCKDGEYLALVYEHMSEGNLADKLRGTDRKVGCLTWRQRLRVALESAQGLEYLHKACSPPFLHRDVKTSNILLSANLKAKVADFGLLKAFNHDDDTHVSTVRVVGTHGYLAPEYASALQLTEKSDVYSFGVVLLEVITGKPPILQSHEPANIIEWVRQRLGRGNIEGVVDACMRDDHDVNSVWKATDVALRCTAQDPTQRPTMMEVVAQLHECLELEESRIGVDTNGSFYAGDGGADPNAGYSMYSSDQSTDMGQSSRTIEMEHNVGRTLATGPATR